MGTVELSFFVILVAVGFFCAGYLRGRVMKGEDIDRLFKKGYDKGYEHGFEAAHCVPHR